MARAFVVGNGAILATGDRYGALCELYVPSLDPRHQLLRRPARLGLTLDGAFHWIDDRFEAAIARGDESPIADLSFLAADRSLELWLETFADSRLPVVARRMEITNRGDLYRDVRLALHHDFALATGTCETAARDAATGGVVHHGGRRVLLLNLAGPEGTGVPQVTISGEGRMADSLLGIPIPLAPGQSAMVTVWITAASSISEARLLDAEVRRHGVTGLVTRTRSFWNLWASAGTGIAGDLPEDVRALYAQSLVTLRLHQAPSGAILSAAEPAPTGATRLEYRWCWLRDAALAADALGRAGFPSSARRYFEFVASSAREGGGLSSVLDASGAPASAPEPILRALDGVALHLWAAGRHFERERDAEFIAPLYHDVLAPIAERLAAAVDPHLGLPLSTDPWDERWGAHAAVAAASRGGLRAASRLAALLGETAKARGWLAASEQIARAVSRSLYDPTLGRFGRGIATENGDRSIDPTVDASLLWLGLVDDLEPEDPRVKATVEAVRSALWDRTGIGGLARYERDSLSATGAGGSHAPGNPSVAATLWLAQHAIRGARRSQDLEAARILLLWASARAEGIGLFPEELHPAHGAPAGVCPSLAATASLVTTVIDYTERARLLARCERCGEPAPARQERRAAVRAPDLLPGIVAHL